MDISIDIVELPHKGVKLYCTAFVEHVGVLS